jgi:membrane-associated phospholipid phosphatase
MKKIIREPRPPDYADVSETLQSKYVNEEKFGMPSGHSESVFFSAAFLWFVIRSPIMLMIELFTPLNIINRTPEGRPVQCSWATLPVNQLNVGDNGLSASCT